MAEFLTMQEAEDKFGKKGKTNAALTLGIIGTSLPVKGNCAYSVFEIQLPATVTPSA